MACVCFRLQVLEERERERETKISGNLAVWFGDNDAARFALIRGSATGALFAEALTRFYLANKAQCPSSFWFARVPTESSQRKP